MDNNRSLWKQSFQIASAYIGTVVGAGFASGQEIMRFFTVYGSVSFFSIILSTVFFIVAGIKIMKIGVIYNASSFKEITDNIFGEKLAFFVNGFLVIALMVTTVAMLAGAGALFEEQLKIPFHIGILITGILAIIAVVKGVQGILSVNTIIVPILIIFNLILLGFSIFTQGHTPIKYPPVSLFTLVGTSVMYVSFNLILSIGVLGAIGNSIHDRKAIIAGGILGGAILGFLIISSNFCLWIHSPEIFDYEIPIVYLVLMIGSGFHFFYAIVVWGEIFSTLIADLFSLVEFADHLSVNKRIAAVTIVGISALFSRIGFSKIVGNMYPLLGFIGILLIVLTLFPPSLRKQ